MIWKIDREKAKASGYSDQEIDTWLAEKNKTTTPIVTETPQPPVQAPTIDSKPKVNIDREAAKLAGYNDAEIDDFLNKSNTPVAPAHENTVAPAQETLTPYEITQEFGVESPYEPQSGGINYGRDYGTPPGTEINLPKAKYRVVSVYNKADPGGGNLNNWENNGYGNSILVRNEDTGEYLRMSHLSTINAVEGSTVDGSKLATTGMSGHVTGPHLDTEYYDKDGIIKNVADTPYKNLVVQKKTTPLSPAPTPEIPAPPTPTPEKPAVPTVEPIAGAEVNRYAIDTPEELKPLFDKASKETGIPTYVLSSQTKAESNFDPNAQSAYASGVSQFTPDTAREFGINPLDPIQAIPAQAKYLKQNIDMFSGDLNKGLAGYNAGPGAVQDAGGIPDYPETINYIDRINNFAKEATSSATLKIEDEKIKRKKQALLQRKNSLLPF